MTINAGGKARASDLAFLGEWTDFTPTLAAAGGSPTLGNATVYARYVQAGRLVRALIDITLGSTSSMGTGYWWLTLPVAAQAIQPSHVGTCFLIDASPSTRKLGWCDIDSTTQRVLCGTYDGTLCAATAPWTWTTGDVIRAEVTYEAA